MFTPEEMAILDRQYFSGDDLSRLALCKRVQSLGYQLSDFAGPMFFSKGWVRTPIVRDKHPSPQCIRRQIEQMFDEKEWLELRVGERMRARWIPVSQLHWHDRDMLLGLCDAEMTSTYLAELGEEFRRVTASWFEQIEEMLIVLALRYDLPQGWKGRYGGKALPSHPIQTIEDLALHLQEVLNNLSTRPPEHFKVYEIDKELRNARIALRGFCDDPKVRPQVNDCPQDFYDAERELERLIDLLEATRCRSAPTGIESAESPAPVNALLVEPQVPEEATAAVSLVLNDTCLGILKALDGRAMRVEELAKTVTGGETTRLYRDGLKTILKANGMIVYDSKIGYFRPDAPPPERVAKVVKLDAKK